MSPTARTMRTVRSLAGSALFLVVAPGTVAGLVPWLITGWRLRLPGHGGAVVAVAGTLLAVVGTLLAVVGTVALLAQFVRFAVVGLGTPAPVAPPRQLVVGGLYRYVRNPMYVAVLAVLAGENLLLRNAYLLAWTLAVGAAMVAFARWYEEPALRARFGEEYETYRTSVPGWIPRRRR